VDSSFQFLGASSCTQALNCYPVYEFFLGYEEQGGTFPPDCCSAAYAWQFFSCWDAVVVNVTSIGYIRWFDCDDVEHTQYIGSVGNYNLVGCVRYNSVDNFVVPLFPAAEINYVDYGNSNCNV
jgi:hypothetical protein